MAKEILSDGNMQILERTLRGISEKNKVVHHKNLEIFGVVSSLINYLNFHIGKRIYVKFD